MLIGGGEDGLALRRSSDDGVVLRSTASTRLNDERPKARIERDERTPVVRLEHVQAIKPRTRQSCLYSVYQIWAFLRAGVPKLQVLPRTHVAIRLGAGYSTMSVSSCILLPWH